IRNHWRAIDDRIEELVDDLAVTRGCRFFRQPGCGIDLDSGLVGVKVECADGGIVFDVELGTALRSEQRDSELVGPAGELGPACFEIEVRAMCGSRTPGGA